LVRGQSPTRFTGRLETAAGRRIGFLAAIASHSLSVG